MSEEKSSRARWRSFSALQRHAAFFDTNDDGRVSSRETFERMRSLGVPTLLCHALTPFIQGFLARLTEEKDGQVAIDKIALGKHPFDTGVYDAEGRVDAAAFDALFAPPSGGEPAPCVTRRDVRRIIRARGDRDRRFGRAGAVLGYVFSGLEVWLLFRIGADCEKREGLGYAPAISRRRLRSFYEGRLFYALARRRRLVLRGIALPRPPKRRYPATA